MPRRVKGPDGRIHAFPDHASDAQISAALKAIPAVNKAQAPPAAQTWSDQLGLNEPTESAAKGFLRGSGAAVVDFTQGAASELSKMMGEKIDAENAAANVFGPSTISERRLPDALKIEAPDTAAGTVGTYAPVVAGMVAPAGPVVKGGQAAVNAFPKLSRATEKFENVMGAARNVPVDISAPGNVALRIQQLADRGGSMPMAVRKFLVRVTDPEKGALNYEEARDFASNISRLSADEFKRLTPVIAREVSEMRVALNKAVGDAAQKAGKRDEYESAMREYARAMRVRSVINAAVEGAKKTAPYATAAGAGYWLTKKMASLIDQ